MSGLSASGLKTQIRSYTEVSDTVLTDAVLENMLNKELCMMCLLMQIGKLKLEV
jgi:hypothetical protein